MLKEQLKNAADMIEQGTEPKPGNFANFEPVLDTLRSMSGLGWRCMYCSGSEGHQVEHWRPKSRFSLDTFTWVNLLWVCGQFLRKNRVDTISKGSKWFR